MSRAHDIANADLKIVFDGVNCFVIKDGLKIAKRGRPDTPQAGTWVSLESGYRVLGGIKDDLVIEYTNDRATRQ
jgi:hypothetical protein